MASLEAVDGQHVRSRRHADTRRDILDAAWRLAEQHGIAGLSLRQLAAEVGMRAPSLYTYFDGKAAIYDAMFAEGYEQLAEVMGELDPRGADAREVISEGLSRWLRFCQRSLPRYQLMFTRAIPDWEPSPEAYAASVTVYEDMTDRFAAAGVTGQRTLDLYTALAAGLAAQQLANDPDGDRWTRLVPEAVEMFLHHVEGRRS